MIRAASRRAARAARPRRAGSCRSCRWAGQSAQARGRRRSWLPCRRGYAFATRRHRLLVRERPRALVPGLEVLEQFRGCGEIVALARGLRALPRAPASIAARALPSASGDRFTPNGLPKCVSAMPQFAIAQPGSFCSTPENASRACENQKEWSSATARSNAGCTSARQDVAKCTVPSRSGGAPPCSCCPRQQGRERECE